MQLNYVQVMWTVKHPVLTSLQLKSADDDSLLQETSSPVQNPVLGSLSDLLHKLSSKSFSDDNS